MNTTQSVGILVCCFVSLWVIGCAVDQAFPEPPPPESYYPSVNHVLESRAEGFASRIIATDRDHVWLELVIAPHAPGPPPHVHATFPENFAVVQGTLSLRVGDQVRLIHAGEEFRVAPGVVHQPFNPTDAQVIVRGPAPTADYALPREFALFLGQIYGFIDELQGQPKPLAIFFQMSIFSPRYDVWLASPSVPLQRLRAALVRPIARLLGYRSYYPRFVTRSTEQAHNRFAAGAPVALRTPLQTYKEK